MLLWLRLLQRAWVLMSHTGTVDTAGCGPPSLCKSRLVTGFAKGALAQTWTGHGASWVPNSQLFGGNMVRSSCVAPSHGLFH